MFRPVCALALAFLIQNLAEAISGGPVLPPPIRPFLPENPNPPAALVLISLAGLAVLLLPLRWPSRPMAGILVAFSAALGANSVLQAWWAWSTGDGLLAAIVGVALMLPASLWAACRAARLIDAPQALIMSVAGVIIAPPVLVAVWWLTGL